MTEPTPDKIGEEPVVATPQPDPTTEKKPSKENIDKKKDFPVGQIAAGGVGVTVLGSYALAAAVGPWGWAAAPAVGAVAGAGYLAHRRRKGRSGMERTKTTITRTRGSRSMRGGGFGRLSGGRSGLSSRSGGVPMSTSAKRSGGLGAASGRAGATGRRPVGGGAPRGRSGGGHALGGSSPRSARGGRAGGAGALFGRGGASRPGSTSRGSGGGLTGRLGRASRGSSSARRAGGGLFGRGSGPTSSKGKTTPPSGTGKPGSSPRTGGSMPKNRWGGASGPTAGSTRGGRIRRGAASARDWADDKTGRRMSTGWRAARKEKGFKARRRAAGQAVREAGGGKFIAGVVGLLAAVFAGLGSLFGWARSKDRPEVATPVSEPADDYHYEYTKLADGTPFVHLIPKRFVESTDPLRLNFLKDRGSAATSTASATSTGGTTMSGLPAAQIAHDMSAAMSRYEPADAYQIVPDSRQWTDVPHQVAMSVKAYADRLEGARFPINDAINDKLREFAQAMAATRAIAEEIEPLMRKAHADDLARKEAPRGDESKWNL